MFWTQFLRSRKFRKNPLLLVMFQQMQGFLLIAKNSKEMLDLFSQLKPKLK